MLKTTLALALAFCALPFFAQADDAPFGGTVYAETDLLNENDPSTFAALSYERSVEVDHYDEREETEVWADFYRFSMRLRDGQQVRIDVSQEFDDVETAAGVAETYGFVFGQMPRVLRRGVRTMVLYPTGDDWYANTAEITIHDGNYDGELADGALEESMIHETVHASLDDSYAETHGWKQAQLADDGFISDYAEESPESEDFAETFTLFYGLMMHPDRFDDETREAILEAVPNRLAFLEKHFPASRLGL